MLNKVKRILQWFIGGCYILSGLAYIGEYTMPAIILIILGGVIILPPITKRMRIHTMKTFRRCSGQSKLCTTLTSVF